MYKIIVIIVLCIIGYKFAIKTPIQPKSTSLHNIIKNATLQVVTDDNDNFTIKAEYATNNNALTELNNVHIEYKELIIHTNHAVFNNENKTLIISDDFSLQIEKITILSNDIMIDFNSKQIAITNSSTVHIYNCTVKIDKILIDLNNMILSCKKIHSI